MTTTPVGSAPNGIKPRTAALVSGIALVVMAVIAGASNFAIVEGLVVAGDPAGTAAIISERSSAVRLGALAFAVTAILDVLVAWGLYELFRKSNSSASLLGAWLRLSYAAVFLVAAADLFGAAQLAATDPSAAYLLASSFRDTWTVGLIIFGCHLLVVGSVAIRATFVHWIFGVLLLVAGVGYIFDSVAVLLYPDFGFQLALYTFVGEVVFIFWLLIRGTRISE
jgi:hypothetical protein